MKKIILALAALFSIISLTISSCSKDGFGRRRPVPNGGDEDIINLVENPNWTLLYKGRSVTIEDKATLVEDIIHIQSKDSKKYYLDAISKAGLNSKHNGKISRFVAASFKKLKDEIAGGGTSYDKALSSGNSSTAFLRLDNGGGSWIAIAYGVSDEGELTKDYSLLNFTTKEVDMKKGENLPIEYTERKPDTEEDVFIVEAKNKTTYYVDVVYDGFVTDKFNGDIYKFFNSMLDVLAKQLQPNEKDFSRLLYRGKTTLLFDRLRAGNWVAYAYGVDNYGFLTGDYTELKFNIKEETATEEFNKWIGKWALSGKAPVYDNNGNKTDEKDVTFAIEISKAEANVAYIISGWETAEKDIVKYTEKLRFEAGFNKKTKNLEFSSFDFGPWKGADNNQYATLLAGLYLQNNKERVFLDKARFADAVLAADGKTAEVKGKQHTDNEGTITFCGMCYIDIRLNDKNEFAKDENGNYIINGYSKYVPYYPYKMEYKGKLEGSSLSMKAVNEAQARNLQQAVRASVRTEETCKPAAAHRQGFGNQVLRRFSGEKVKTQERRSSSKRAERK